MWEVLLALAPDAWWVAGGRVFTGIGVGLTAGLSTAAILEFPEFQDTRRAALSTVLAQAGGFTAALFVSGVLTEYGPWPTRLTFWVLVALLALLEAGIWLMPADRHRVAIGSQATGHRKSRMPYVPREIWREYLIASTAMMVACSFGVLVLSLGAQVEHNLIGSSNALVNGAVMALFPLSGGLFGLISRQRPARIGFTVGGIVSILGMGLLVFSVIQQSLFFYFIATSTSGASYSFLFAASVQLINATAPPDHRAGVLSALHLAGYLAMGVLAVALGALATTLGLELAVSVGAVVIALASIAILVLSPLARG